MGKRGVEVQGHSQGYTKKPRKGQDHSLIHQKNLIHINNLLSRDGKINSIGKMFDLGLESSSFRPHIKNKTKQNKNPGCAAESSGACFNYRAWEAKTGGYL